VRYLPLVVKTASLCPPHDIKSNDRIRCIILARDRYRETRTEEKEEMKVDKRRNQYALHSPFPILVPKTKEVKNPLPMYNISNRRRKMVSGTKETACGWVGCAATQ
jgi:hypothetical protein